MFEEEQSFSLKLGVYKDRKKLGNYIDTIIEYCNEYDLELEGIDNLLTPKIKEALREEYEALNYLPKISRINY